MGRDQMKRAMAGTRASHVVLLETLAGLTDDQVGEPSMLPGWTRGHVLAHIARNADSHVRMLTAAARGEKVEQYAGGAEGRTADIEAGAGRPAAEQVADIEETARRLFEVWEEIPESVWDEDLLAISHTISAWETVFSRWRETEIHHADLALGYGYNDWPTELVDVTLPHLADTIANRLPPGAALAITASDTGYSASAGPADARHNVVEGPARTLLAWLAGREFDRDALRVVEGELPDLGRWV